MTQTATTPMERLTKYERARILGLRATQLSKGATPMVSTEGLTDDAKIAERELLAGKLPFIIRRKFPDGTYTDIKVSDMIIS